MYALALCARDPKRHSVIALDEAWVLFDSSVGRQLLDRTSRLSRSQNRSLFCFPLNRSSTLKSSSFGCGELCQPPVWVRVFPLTN
jgi:hypothetical protein